MNKIPIVMMALMLSLTFASAYNMSEEVSSLTTEVITFDWTGSILNQVILVYNLLQKVILQDAIIQELSKRPVSCSCGGGGSSQTSTQEQQIVPQEIRGDVTGEGNVNQADVTALTRYFGTDDSRFDLSGDGFVGQADLDIILSNVDGSSPYQSEIDHALTM